MLTENDSDSGTGLVKTAFVKSRRFGYRTRLLPLIFSSLPMRGREEEAGI